MKRHTIFVLLVVLALGVALLSCSWSSSLRSFLQTTPTPVAAPTAEPTPELAASLPGGPITEEALLTEIYERVSPSVVHIRVSEKVEGGTTPFGQLPGIPLPNPQLPQMPDEFYRWGEGSGFVWDEEGHIVTNYHVVANATTVDVHFFDDTVVEAEIVGLDEQSDIAVLKVDPNATQLRPVALGDSDTLQVGQMAIAIGNPFGQTWTMTRGIISAIGRTIRPGSNPFAIPEMIQTDAAINPGNSGGPLLNSQGHVIGMNTMILSRSGASAGVGFAVPIDIVKQVVPELIANGHYAYPWLGIQGRDLAPEDVTAMDLATSKGALVISVTQDSPADRAGLRGSDRTITVEGIELNTGGDVIVGIDGQAINGMDDLITYLVRHTRPDQKVTLDVIREGKTTQITVTLGERPEKPGE